MAQNRENATFMHTRAKGNVGEDIACSFIVSKGFTVIERNYRKKWGELDIVAVKDDELHFFEVKSVEFGLENTMVKGQHMPEENVHALKVRHLRRIIQTYMVERVPNEDTLFEFHVLCVFMDMKRRRAAVKWLKNIIL